jgi:hypothetical protein
MKAQVKITIDIHEDSAWATIVDAAMEQRPTIGEHRRRFTSDAALIAAIAAKLHEVRVEAESRAA